jgi:hypothetical protein
VVVAKHFGKSCFDCPALGTEDINLACMMHNTDVEMFVKELIEATQKEAESASCRMFDLCMLIRSKVN